MGSLYLRFTKIYTATYEIYGLLRAPVSSYSEGDQGCDIFVLKPDKEVCQMPEVMKQKAFQLEPVLAWELYACLKLHQ